MAYDNENQKNINNHVRNESNIGTKTKYFKDVNDRYTFIVTAPKSAQDGDQASVVQFGYFGSTNIISSQLEYTTSWDSTWDELTEDTPA